MPSDSTTSIPITVIGGYLGAGKTTLLNALLARAGGRRIGIIVNDFGELGIDADLVREALGPTSDGGGPTVVNLPNGCVCCTLGDDLHEALDALASTRPRLDHIVVEASGVADPAATAAWGTVSPFARGGTVVLVAADTIATLQRDRYVGGEVRRQITGADVVVITKADLCRDAVVDTARSITSGLTSAPQIIAAAGDLPIEVVLGLDGYRASPAAAARLVPDAASHDTTSYARWSFSSDEPASRTGVQLFLDALPAGMLRLKGTAELATPAAVHLVVQVVGQATEVVEVSGAAAGVRLEAIGVAGRLEPAELDALAVDYLRRA